MPSDSCERLDVFDASGAGEAGENLPLIADGVWRRSVGFTLRGVAEPQMCQSKLLRLVSPVG